MAEKTVALEQPILSRNERLATELRAVRAHGYVRGQRALESWIG